MKPSVGLAVAFLLGATTILGFAPFQLFLLPLASLAVLVALWQVTTPARAALQGSAFGLGFFLSGVSWVYVSMHDYGGMPAALAALATFLFCVYLALYPALAGYLFARLRQGRLAVDALALASAWTLTEWLRGWVLTGFPWLALGYAQTPPSPLAGFAPVLGVYGVGWVSALVAALAGLVWWQRRETRLRVAALLAAGLAVGAALTRIAWTEPVTRPLSVSLLQGNIDQSLKWRPERLTQSLEIYLRLAQAHPARLIVLPETALPIMLDQLQPKYAAQLRRPAEEREGDVLIGIAEEDSAGRYYNSAVSFGASPVQGYSKSHLVPFGEFIPPFFTWSLEVLSIPMSNFSPGPPRQPLLSIAGEKVAPNICYEDLFGEAIIHALPEASLLVNLSNTAWFGRSLAQPQHLQIAQMRALETGRPMLRATNTGMTAIVGSDGLVQAVLPPFTEGALTAEVQGHTGATPYVCWGNYAVLLLVMAGWWAPLLGPRRAAQ